MTDLVSITMFAGSLYLFALLMNIVRKNTTLVVLYLLQSLVVALALFALSQTHETAGLLYAALLTLLVKVVLAPYFLLRMIRRYSAHYSAASYLGLPLSLLVLAVLMVFSYSFIFSSISDLKVASIPLSLASIFSVLFLMVNRRGALAQIVGVLALENGVVLLAAFLGIEHSFALELVIAFDIAVWIAIAGAFLTMMYRQFGEIEVAATRMTHLTEE